MDSARSSAIGSLRVEPTLMPRISATKVCTISRLHHPSASNPMAADILLRSDARRVSFGPRYYQPKRDALLLRQPLRNDRMRLSDIVLQPASDRPGFAKCWIHFI